MNSETLEKSIKNLDKKILQKGRKVALVVDYCTAHTK